jgi:hypothetical protein
MKFMRRTPKFTWQNYRTNGNVLSALEINPVVKKIEKKIT